MSAENSENEASHGLFHVITRVISAQQADTELFRSCLALLVQATRSEFGFIGRLEDSGRVQQLAVSDVVLAHWLARDTAITHPTHGSAQSGLYARLLCTGKSFFANNLRANATKDVLPEGHPTIESFLGVALLHEARLLGVLALANRPGGYDDADMARVEALAPALAKAILSYSKAELTRAAPLVLARLYSVLSQVNEVIVRVRDESALLTRTCQIVASEGVYALVWIGFVENGTISPIAWSDAGAEYARQVRIEVMGEFGAGPTGTCVREGRPVVNDDFATNPSTTPWRTDALGQGFRSSAAFPLRRGGAVVGAMTLYATRPGAFDSDHVNLLESLCEDISYALDTLEHERQRVAIERTLRASEQSLREADRRKNAFLAVLSHELRNPLMPLHSSLHILERVPPGSEQAQKALATIARQTRQLTRLVDDLLDVTRITRNKLRIRRTRLDMTSLVTRIVEDYRVRFSDAGLTLDVEHRVDDLWIDGDEQRMAQVISNLLTNAIKFTPRGGMVSLILDAEESAGMSVLRVRDTGVGISTDMLPRLFEAFVQADDSLDRSQSGLGLGLAIAKAVVDMHGGRIEVGSEGLGRGSEFVVRVPFVQAERLAKPASISTRPPPPRRVLIIEDNEDAADCLRDVLELSHHTVDIAYDGREGLVKAREFNPDVVLCDIGLPGMSGFDVARAFRNDHVLGSTYLVAITGYTQTEDRERAERAGFNFHLPKPLHMEHIQELFVSLAKRIDVESH